MLSERKHGLVTEQLSVSTYVGYLKNLKDLKDNSHPFEDYPLAGSAAILCSGGPDVIRKEAWPFYITIPVSAYVGSSKNLKDHKGSVAVTIKSRSRCDTVPKGGGTSLHHGFSGELIRSLSGITP